MIKTQLFFEQFYQMEVEYSINQLESIIGELQVVFLVEIMRDFRKHLSVRFQNVCLRTLIVEMGDKKHRGLLQGENSEEQYKYFCESFLSTEKFRWELFCKYPILQQCMHEIQKQSISLYVAIIRAFYEERSEIGTHLCKGKEIHHITKIYGENSDSHNQGRQAMRVQVDGIVELIYKPHSMENEQAYDKILAWMEDKTKITQKHYCFLSYADHSWSTIVKHEGCESNEQVRRFYNRIGVQLFLAFILGTKDLHAENVIASTEYPVLIDLETISNICFNKQRLTAEEEVRYELAQSVMYTGILPFYTWNSKTGGVDHSALGGQGGTPCSIKLPTILNPYTSEMRIGYREAISPKTENRVRLQNRIVSPSQYEKEILYGFSSAYVCVLKRKKEFANLVQKELVNINCRYLLEDTQKYSMILSASYHPSLLRKEGDREEFLLHVQDGRVNIEKKVIKCEIRALLSGDIPYFSFDIRKKDLCIFNGVVIRNYFENSALELIQKKICILGKEDLSVQREYIEMSLRLMRELKEGYYNGTYSAKEKEKRNTCLNLKRDENYLKHKLLNQAVWNKRHTDVSWPVVQVATQGPMAWRIGSMNIYLYDGLAGMLLLFGELMIRDKNSEIQEIYLVLKQKLFHYTEECSFSRTFLQSRYTGMYAGESSIILVYIVLYQIMKDEEYLHYAERHTIIVDSLLEEDHTFDLLSGNAGAAQCFLILYKCTKNIQYLDRAKYIINMLERNAVENGQGIGWITNENISPMSGLAHGNSGVLIPVVTLWSITREPHLEQLIEKILNYEESLYSEENENWIDVHLDESEQRASGGAVAWCHGATGILLSRMLCSNMVKDYRWKKQFMKDAERAYKVLKKYWVRDSCSLCHGISGNLWVLEKATRFLRREWEGEALELGILPYEKVNPGLMNGYGGVLYWLLKRGTETGMDVFQLDMFS